MSSGVKSSEAFAISASAERAIAGSTIERISESPDAAESRKLRKTLRGGDQAGILVPSASARSQTTAQAATRWLEGSRWCTAWRLRQEDRNAVATTNPMRAQRIGQPIDRAFSAPCSVRCRRCRP